MKKQAGVSMIEVLIAVLILAIGLLGVASMQIRAVQGTQSSNLRTLAATLAQEGLDSFRATRSPAAAGVAAAQTAALAAWNARIARVLPGGAGTIVFQQNPSIVGATGGGVSPGGGVLTVTIRWDDTRWVIAAAPTQFILRGQI